MARMSKGVRVLTEYRKGSRLTFKQAVLAKCADCMNLYADGMQDCHVPACPLYGFMPYRETPLPRSTTRQNTGLFKPRSLTPAS
jgi:hypothetical protein